MIEAMIDNETWGIRATSVVRSVGVVVFDGATVLEKHYFRIDEQQQLEERLVWLPDIGDVTMAPRTIDRSTKDWWAKPENAKAQATILEAPLVTWDEGRTILGRVGDKVKHVWAKPAMFDLPMLRDLFGQDIWKYWQEQDMATLLAQFDPDRKTRPQFTGVPHNALDDAMHAHLWLRDLRLHISLMMSKNTKTPGGKIWECKIGECTEDKLRLKTAVPDGWMRAAVEEAYVAMTGQRPNFICSGWGGSLTVDERAVVNNVKG